MHRSCEQKAAHRTLRRPWLLLLALALCVAAQGAGSAPPADAGFPSAEAAFVAAFLDSGIGRRGFDENREYAAALYQMPDGRWHATLVLAGTRLGSAIPYHAVPPEAVRIVGAHTHGQPHIPEDPIGVYGTEFSRVDLRTAFENFDRSAGRIGAQLLLTSDLRILRLTLSRQDKHAGDTKDAQGSKNVAGGSGEIVARTQLLARVRFDSSATAYALAQESDQASAVPITLVGLARSALQLPGRQD